VEKHFGELTAAFFRAEAFREDKGQKRKYFDMVEAKEIARPTESR
jgi:hypothetical protein